MAIQQDIDSSDTGLDAAIGAAKISVHAGAQALTSNYDYSAVTRAVWCEVNAGFVGTGFTAANPQTMAFIDRFVYNAGAGNWYWKSQSSDSLVTNRVFVWGGGTLHVDGSGTVTNYHQLAGTLNIPNGHTATNMYLAGGVTNIYDTGTGSTITALHGLGGVVNCQRPVTTLNVSGGTVTIDKASDNSVNAFGTVNIYAGGTVVVKDSSTISALNWYGGNLVWASTRPTTIEACSVNFSLPGARQFVNNPLLYFEAGGPTALVHDGR